MQKQALQAGRTKPVGGACSPLNAKLRTKVHLAGRHVGIIPDIFRHQLRKINQSLQTRNAGFTVRAAAAAQDAIDVDASVIDDRIPVTVRSFLPVFTALNQLHTDIQATTRKVLPAEAPSCSF